MNVKMKIITLLFCSALAASATPWQVLRYYPGYTFADAPGNAFAFPDAAAHQLYPAFLVCTQPEAMDLRGATIHATFTVDAEAGTAFRYGGEGTWNGGTSPANVRLFFGTAIGYSNVGSGNLQYWFHDPASITIYEGTGSMSLTAEIHREDWSDAGGCASCPPATDADFWNATQNVHEIGFAFGGGSFFDVGIAVTTGTATFQLTSYEFNPRVSLRIDDCKQIWIMGGFSQASYLIEKSSDLVTWEPYAVTTTAQPTPMVEGFFRARE